MAENTNIENQTQDENESHVSKEKLKINKIQYDGKTGQIYKIWLMNIFLDIITLGIHSFWGKTRLRKYVYGLFSLDGDRFEYTGTGGELFKGFLKVLPILVILFGPISIWGEQYPALLLLYIPMFYLFGVAIYGAMRYRFSRTRWRGIRARLGGSAFEYANISIVRVVLNAVSLGFLIPHSDIKKTKYMYENIYFGNVKAEYKGNVKNIYSVYIKSLFMMLGVMIIPAIFFAIPIILEVMSESVTPVPIAPIDFEDASKDIQHSSGSFFGFIAAISYLLGVFTAVILLPISRCMYTAALMREQMRGLVIGDLRFKSKVDTWSLARHKLGNTLWIIFTLGLATPHVIQRNAMFFAANTIIGGNLDTSRVMQGKDDGITSGEGLEDAFDIDVGFI